MSSAFLKLQKPKKIKYFGPIHRLNLQLRNWPGLGASDMTNASFIQAGVHAHAQYVLSAWRWLHLFDFRWSNSSTIFVIFLSHHMSSHKCIDQKVASLTFSGKNALHIGTLNMFTFMYFTNHMRRWSIFPHAIWVAYPYTEAQSTILRCSSYLLGTSRVFNTQPICKMNKWTLNISLQNYRLVASYVFYTYDNRDQNDRISSVISFT